MALSNISSGISLRSSPSTDNLPREDLSTDPIEANEDLLREVSERSHEARHSAHISRVGSFPHGGDIEAIRPTFQGGPFFPAEPDCGKWTGEQEVL